MSYSTHKPWLVLASGWALDCRIFNFDFSEWNVIEMDGVLSSDFSQRVLDVFSDHGVHKARFLGFSLGGYLCLDFAEAYPEYVDGLCVIGLRDSYPSKDIDLIRKFLKKSPDAYIRSFLKACCYGDETLKALIESQKGPLDVDYLLDGLTYLEQVDLQELPECLYIHGTKDQIAPYVNRREDMVSPNCGHFVFEDSVARAAITQFLAVR